MPRALAAFAMTWPAALVAQAPAAPTAIATRAAGPPAIDGRLTDGAWTGASGIETLVQREPFEGRPASERTRVRFLYDDQALYVGAWLFDRDPSGVVTGQNLRDASLTDSDAFLIVLDTYLDRQNGFVFGTTPAGIEYDGQVTNEGQGGGQQRQQSGTAGGFNLNWDGSWQVATSRDSAGWYAEMRIPFSTLRYGKGGAQVWGLNLERRIRRNNELSVWAPLPRQFDINRVSLAGTLQLEAPAKRVVTVSPYALTEGFRDFRVAAPETDLSARLGADAKIGVSQSLTLDLTLNTDFALAEVDDQQVNLTRFSLFFPEKRGFFLENAGAFAVGASRSAELFFTRRIGLASGREVPIIGGARLTGKVGKVQLGLLSIQTDDLNETDPSTGAVTQVSPSNNFSVFRLYREFANRSRLGGILVSRVNTGDTGDNNLTVGLDGRLGIGQDITLDGWLGLTRTPRYTTTDEGGFNDGEYALGASGQYSTRIWQISAGYRQVGEAFNPEVGFVNRWAYRHGNARISRNVRTDGVPWFREFRPHVSWNQFWSLDGFSESYLVHIDMHFAFANGAFFQLPGFNLTGEGLREPFEIRPGIVIPAGSYDNIDWEFRANTNRAAPLSVSGGWDLGGFYTGTRFGPTATIAWRHGDVLSATLRANYFDVRLDEGRFTTAVYGLAGSWSFTPRAYLQANVQYNDDTRNLASNVRLGWLDDAGTGFFVVFNDAWHRGPFDRTGILAGPQQRQLVVKISRLLDLTR
ncbi:MAG: carbohydrate binding family 9 domain-containing protein [Gemmatimonadaceae bacterium]|nr:carbohydrate binding family 9 domain-containing protein [Gemmatimonadaceae bacterium]